MRNLAYTRSRVKRLLLLSTGNLPSMASQPLWPADLSVEEHLDRVRQWGGPQLWLAALDRAEEILAPKFSGKWDNGWHIQDAAPGFALLIYLMSRASPHPPAEISEQEIINAYPTLAFQDWSGTRLHRTFADALRRYGHDIDYDNGTDPVVRTWYEILLRSDEPATDAPETAFDSETRIGTVLQTGLPALIAELRVPGTWLVPCPTKNDHH
jgi:hypothetical protein